MVIAVAGPAGRAKRHKTEGFLLTWRVRRLRSQSWIDAMAFDRKGQGSASVLSGAPPPASRRLDKAARPTPERRRLGVAHASGDRLGSGPLRLPHVRLTIASGRARLVTGKAPPHAPDVVGRGFTATAVACPGRALAPGCVGLPLMAVSSPFGRRERLGLRIADMKAGREPSSL